MWRAFLPILLLLMAPASRAQSQPDIFLASLQRSGENWSLGPARNISNNPGYDNQPAFAGPSDLFYSGTRGSQTDIARFSLVAGRHTWISDTPNGSEYSPLKIPGREAVSAIRLDTSGLQRLHSYPLGSGRPEVLLEGLKVGYHVWFGADRIVCTVLEADRMDLLVVYLPENNRYVYQKGVGRCLQRIPGTQRISFTRTENGKHRIYGMDPISGATSEIAVLPDGVQDYCWLPDGSLLHGNGNRLFRMKPGIGSHWVVLGEFPERQLGAITRLSVSPDGTRIAFAAEPR